jgi:hypothetical protein
MGNVGEKGNPLSHREAAADNRAIRLMSESQQRVPISTSRTPSQRVRQALKENELDGNEQRLRKGGTGTRSDRCT